MVKQFLMRVRYISLHTKFRLTPFIIHFQTKLVKIAPRNYIGVFLGAPLLILVTACTPPILEEEKEWNDKYDPEQWRERFKECQPFLYMEDDSWHWCMEKNREKRWDE